MSTHAIAALDTPAAAPLDENERQLAAIDAGIAEADAGLLLDHDDVRAELQGKLAALAAKR